MGKNVAHGALHQTVASQGTAINYLINKNDLEDCFDNVSAAVPTGKVVLEQLMVAIAALTMKNEALVVTNSKLAA